jgi:purine-cytosine permease-like protein
VQVFGKAFQKVKRYIWTLIGAVIYIIIAIIGSQNFASTLEAFLLDVAYWLGAYAVILVIEHFVFRRGQYNVDDWNTPSRLPLGWAAIVALVAGLVGALLGADQLNFQGFITRNINQPYGIDLGFELSVVFAAIVYLILRNIEIRTSPRGETAAEK